MIGSRCGLVCFVVQYSQDNTVPSCPRSQGLGAEASGFVSLHEVDSPWELTSFRSNFKLKLSDRITNCFTMEICDLNSYSSNN